MEKIVVKFDGKLAADGKLRFYEYGRSQYALARFLNTIEHYRRTGNVAQKISSRNYVETIISVPESGSFLTTIIIPAIQQGAATVVSLPLSALISSVWSMLAPRRETTEQFISEVAKIKLAEEKQRTKQEHERTRQLRELRRIIEGERASTDTALGLVRYALERSDPQIASIGYELRQIRDMQQELLSEKAREKELEEYEDLVSELDPDKMQRLTSRLRPMVSEIGLPLKQSASDFFLNSGPDGRPVTYLNEEIAKDINKKKFSKKKVEIVGLIKSYDRLAGVGKVVSEQLPRQLNFVVPAPDRRRLRDKILEAMTKDDVKLICQQVEDGSGLPTSLVLIDLELSPK